MIVDDDLIAKFLSGEASPEEAMALHEWLAIPANKARFDEMSSTWDQTNPPKVFGTLRKDVAWKKVRPAKSLAWPIGIAASVLLIISLFIIKNIFSDADVVQLTASTIDSTRNVSLADNSDVTLYKNTSIQYPERFEKDSRQVKLLSGEAFFKITKDTTKPFIVHAAFANIRVVGTQFNVIVKDNGVSVGVEEGMVQIITATDSVYVGKGAAAFVRSGEPVRKARMDENTWAYATQKLVFKDTPMSEVIESLEKTYSVNISVSNDDVKKCRFTATFDKDNVGKILLLVSETLNSKLEQNGQDYTLEGGDGCP